MEPLFFYIFSFYLYIFENSFIVTLKFEMEPFIFLNFNFI